MSLVGLCLATGWPPSEIRSLTVRERHILVKELETRARSARMQASARKVAPARRRRR